MAHNLQIGSQKNTKWVPTPSNIGPSLTETFSAIPGNSRFCLSMKAVTSSTGPIIFRSGSTFTQSILEHTAKEQAAPRRPKEDSCCGLERLRDTPFKLNAPRMFKTAAQHKRKIFLARSKRVGQATKLGGWPAQMLWPNQAPA